VNISAVLACRNEEPFIQAWLESTSAYAQEILIAMNGPTDATADIIARFKGHSSVPIHCEWFPARTVARFGYSVMKNEMIARATGDWITSIDADEEIGLSPVELRQALAAAMAAGRSALRLRLASHPRPQDVAEDVTMEHRLMLREAHRPLNPPVPKTRIVRNRAGYWWQGIVHEHLTRHGEDATVFSFFVEADLHHYAYLRRPHPPWKGPLYSSLICRARDVPHLRSGVNRAWYVDLFEPNEAAIRAEAARLRQCGDDWFPEVPRRDL
jgi:glycosyltransferase involved in cell wall biosynthesis